MEIQRERKIVKAITKNGEEFFQYDKLILAQGSTPVVPPIPGIENDFVFKLWTIPDMDRIHKFIEEKKPTKAVVAGGGFIGLEMAEALHARGIKVTIVELAPQLMITMDPEFGEMIKAGIEEKGISVKINTGLSGIENKLVTLSDGSKLETDMILLSIGARPVSALAKSAGLEMGASGGLIVDETMRTSDPDIFAAGDLVEVVNKIHGKKVRIPLAGPANRQGRIAGTNALGGKMVYRGALGTSVVKLFDRTAASTGLTEKIAREVGYNVGVSYVFKDNHVTYFPGGKPLALKIVYDKKTNRLLGGQAYGEVDVEKRIDVLATALHGKMTLEDLSEIDFAYAPPYNSANDPVNIASFIGINNISGYSPTKTPADVLEDTKHENTLILDVRTVGEQAKAQLLDVLHIPADEIRDRLDEIPKDKILFVLSKDGFLGHTSLQILKAEGWKDVYNIAGGYSAARWFDGWNFNN